MFLLLLLLLSCMTSSYILDINPLPDIWLANTSPFHTLPFYFVDCFFYCAEIFYFDIIPLAGFYFVACAFGVISKDLLPIPMWKNVSPIFSFTSFIVSGPMFKSLIQFHFPGCGYPVFSMPFIKETIISPLSTLGSVAKY